MRLVPKDNVDEGAHVASADRQEHLDSTEKRELQDNLDRREIVAIRDAQDHRETVEKRDQ